MTGPAPSLSVAADTTVIAPDRLAAQQWEAYLAKGAIAVGASAWAGPTVMSYRAWVRELWSLHHDADDADLLSPQQSLALWKRVIAESAEGNELIGVGGAARWAADARHRVMGWRIDATAGEPDRRRQDFAAFLAWHKVYEERLAASRWIDDAQIEAALTRKSIRGSGRIGLTEFAELSPSQQSLFARLDALGWRNYEIAAPSVAGIARHFQCADGRDEIVSAARWAVERLRVNAKGPVAIVVPGLLDNGLEIRRLLLDELGEAQAAPGGIAANPLFLAAEVAAPVDLRPLTGAALNAIEMLSPGGTFAAFSRWLRNPFFHRDPEVRSRAARIEVQLRLEMVTRLPFVDAFRRGGLRERLQVDLPSAAAAIEAGLAELGAAKVRTPAHWARLWPRVLQRLGWQGWPASQDGTESREQACWDKALTDLALLTPIVGSVSSGRALAELEANLQRPGSAPLPLGGIHVFADMESVGPGYIGAWVCGCTDSALPRATRLNPLLPRALQIAQAMPWSSPQDALRRSEALVSRLRMRVPDCIFSWPAREHEQPSEPSPLIRMLASLDDEGVYEGRRGGEDRFDRPVRLSSAREKGVFADPAPPLIEQTIVGGTATIDAQARCPVRAFCEYRLGARPLEPFGRGIPARLQGVALHGALERFYRRVDRQSSLAALGNHELQSRVRHGVEEALALAFGSAKAALPVLFDLESERLTALLQQFTRRELERSPFRVAAVEERQLLELRGRLMRTRIDRIDELEDGTLAIIDYKSGRNAQSGGWFLPRVREPQLPLYAIALRAKVSALVIATLRCEGIGYAGLWLSSPREFPNRSRRLRDGSTLQEQIDIWSDRIALLVDEYAAGDSRFFIGDTEPAEGAFAPLTRIYEQLALHRGWLSAGNAT